MLPRILRSVTVLSLWLAICFASARSLADSPAETAFAELAKKCDANVTSLQVKLDRVRMWSNIFMVAGAIVAAFGSASAGLLEKMSQRKVAAVVGAAGAVITVLPATLPDKSELQSRLSLADRHRQSALSVRNQLLFAQADESTTEANKYVSARYTSCAALEPQGPVPDFFGSQLRVSATRGTASSLPRGFASIRISTPEPSEVFPVPSLRLPVGVGTTLRPLTLSPPAQVDQVSPKKVPAKTPSITP